MMVHTYNPSTWDVEAGKSGEYKASLKQKVKTLVMT